ncbi:MAG: hypothetical protein IH946_03990, partial [Bacteroidetes bacterium]|nr:hypothetical protein [Bacteroidota bacterium]
MTLRGLIIVLLILKAVETSPQGIIWHDTFGGATDDDRVNSIFPTSDGGMVLTGYTAAANSKDGDLFILKLDVDQQVEWQDAMGGEKPDEGHCIIQTSDGGYMVVGTTE